MGSSPFLNLTTGEASTITSANSVVTIAQSTLFPSGVNLQGYSVDKAWSTDALEIAETQKGVDGRMTAGWIFNTVKMTFQFQADSPSISVFQNIWSAMRAARDVYYLSGNIEIPSTGETFSLVKGVLKSVKTIPDAAKVLQAMEFVVEWSEIVATLS